MALQSALGVANMAQSMEPAVQAALTSGIATYGPEFASQVARAARRGNRSLKKYLSRRTRSAIPSSGSKRKPKKPSAGKNSSSGVFSARSAGSHPVATKSKKRGPVKASLKKRIGKLEKALGQTGMSTYKFCLVKPWSLSIEAQESRGTASARNLHPKIIYNLEGNWRWPTVLSKLASSIPKTDDNANPPTAVGTNVSRHVKRHVKYEIKNTGLMTAHVKYVKYRAKQDTSQAPLQGLQSVLADRLLPTGSWETDLGPVSTVGAESSYVPKRLIFVQDQAYAETFQFLQELDDFKTIGKVGSTLLQPSDTFELYDTFDRTMKSEQTDRNAETYGPQETYGYFIQVTGVMATDNTNLDHVGTSDFEISVMSRDFMTLRIDNSLGQKFYDYDVNAMSPSANGFSSGSPAVDKVQDES